MPVNNIDDVAEATVRQRLKPARVPRCEASLIPFIQLSAPLPMTEVPREASPKWDWTVFPVLGGSSDFGVLGGAAASIARHAKERKPYQFQAALILSTSFKDNGDGIELVQHKHAIRFDWLGLFHNRLRLSPAFNFERTANSGYFGLGNASEATPIDSSGTFGRRYQFIHNEVRGRLNARIALVGPWSLIAGTTHRYSRPTAYDGSQLATDSATTTPDGAKTIYGTEPLYQPSLQFGVLYDRRDNEVTPSSGGYHELAVRTAIGFPLSSEVRSAGASIVLRQYFSLFGPVVLAIRALGDFAIGNVPFYDLAQGGSFIAEQMPGGAQGVRGVPNGRFAGLAKVVGNVELRAMVFEFRIARQKFRVGLAGFVDGGRVWLDYKKDPRDGTGVGLKYGVGAGVYFQWGVALFRFDVAYSPDARAANPSLPVGLYVAEGQLF